MNEKCKYKQNIPIISARKYFEEEKDYCDICNKEMKKGYFYLNEGDGYEPGCSCICDSCMDRIIQRKE